MTAKNHFVRDLKEIERLLEGLATGQEAGRAVEWSINSAAWKILKEIRKPESAGGWLTDTWASWKKWGFERIKMTNKKVTFSIFNNAPALRGRLKGHAYAGWVYAKGDGLLRRPIAPGIIKRAIMQTVPTIEENYRLRLEKYLSRGRK